MKLGNRSKLGSNISANEKNRGYAFSARRYDRGTLLGLPRSREARTDGCGAQECPISVGCNRYPRLRSSGNCSCLSLACSAESSGYSSESSALVGLVLDRHVLQPVSAWRNRRRHHQELFLAQRNA